MQDAWRAYLELALGLAEAPRKKAQRAVGDLVNRGGTTAAQLQGLAEDLMSAGTANREALSKIVRYEVDRALGMVGLATADEVAELTARVRELEQQLRQAQGRLGGTQAAAAPGAPAHRDVPAGPEGPGLNAPYRAAGGNPPSATQLDAPAPLPRTTRAAKSSTAKASAAKATAPKPARAKGAAGKQTPASTAPATTSMAKKAVARKAAGPVEASPAPLPGGPVRPDMAAATKATAAPAKAVAKKATTKKAVARRATGGKAVAERSDSAPPPGPDPSAVQP